VQRPAVAKTPAQEPKAQTQKAAVAKAPAQEPKAQTQRSPVSKAPAQEPKEGQEKGREQGEQQGGEHTKWGTPANLPHSSAVQLRLPMIVARRHIR
jgi:hypothetical protein